MCIRDRGVHFKHELDIRRFLRVYHQLLCVDAVHFDRLGVEAVGSLASHFEAPLTAGIVSVCHPLLYRFPFKLGEHDTDIQHNLRYKPQ